MGKEMNNGPMIFAITVSIALSSFAYMVVSAKQNEMLAVKTKCEDAGWTWLAKERKCLMIKELK